MIDYVQLVRGNGNSRYGDLRDAHLPTESAKSPAVPVIALAQLNRRSAMIQSDENNLHRPLPQPPAPSVHARTHQKNR